MRSRTARARIRWIVLLCMAVVAILSPIVPANAAGSWQTLPGSSGGACHSGGVSGWSKYTWCWGKQKLRYDGQPTRDTFSWRMTLSGNATNGKHLKRLWVEPFPRSSSPTQHWRGTDPFRPDHTVNSQTNCVTNTTSVGGGSIPLTYATSQQSCDEESFGPKLYSTPGHHAGIWRTGNYCSLGTSQVRKVYATMTVWVAAGKIPLWNTTHRGADAKRCL